MKGLNKEVGTDIGKYGKKKKKKKKRRRRRARRLGGAGIVCIYTPDISPSENILLPRYSNLINCRKASNIAKMPLPTPG